MSKVERPRLFIIQEIESILKTAISEMELINSEVISITKEYQLKSLLTYIFARYESALSDSLIEYFIAFPEKMDTSKISIRDDLELLSEQSLSTEFKRRLAENYVSTQFFKNLEEVLKLVERQLSVNINSKEITNKVEGKESNTQLNCS